MLDRIPFTLSLHLFLQIAQLSNTFNPLFSAVGDLKNSLEIDRSVELISWSHAKKHHFHQTLMSSTASKLWAENSLMALRCLYHPFVAGLAIGNLPVKCFQHYIGWSEKRCFGRNADPTTS